MRKSIILAFILIIISLEHLAAVYLEVAPFNGAYGVSMSNEFYTGGDYKGTDESGFDDAKHYSNNELIAVGGLQDLSESDYENFGNELKISVSCPNGLYFVSQSNPAFRRPFELLLVWTDQRSYTHQKWAGWGVYKSEEKTDNQYKEYGKSYVSELNPATYGKMRDWILQDDYSESWGYGDKYTDQELDFWCDIVLVLPGELIPGTDIIEAEDEYGRLVQYPLIEAADYTALVTITFEYGDLPPKSITIPFSGYYERNNTVKKEGVCSMLIEPTAAAAQLSITRDRGSWVTVGTLEFMQSTFESPLSKPVIFASSSPDPKFKEDKFRMVHESVAFNTPLTSTNSIGYKVRIRNTGSTGTGSYEFYGDESIDNVINSGYGSFGIVPEVTPAKMQHSNTMDYYSYSGDIDVMLDAGSNFMKAGRYSGTVYIHVVADENTGY